MLFPEGSLELRHRDLENAAQLGEDARPGPAREAGRPDADDVRKLVADERTAAIVVDRPARRLDANRSQLVVLGGSEIALTGEHLERPEPEEEDGEGEEDERPEHAQPERDLRRHPIRRLDAWVARHEARPRRPDAREGRHQFVPSSTSIAGRAPGGVKMRRQSAYTGIVRSRFRTIAVGSAPTSPARAETGSPST